jgi:sulfite reductase alpha subunit-like flavoprotein
MLTRVRTSPLGLKPDLIPLNFLAVCTGSGIAPFLAYTELFEKAGQWPQATILVFGCRDEVLYKDRIDAWVKEGKIRALLAVTRNTCKERIYVQDLVRKDAAVHQLVQSSFSKKNRIIVCGSGAMGRAVLQEIALQVGGQAALEELQKSGVLSTEFFR